MNAIKKYREAAGLTQAIVANVLDISTDTLWRWESNTSEPRATELRKMSDLFGCTIDELVGKNPTQPLPTQETEQGEKEAV